MGRTSGRGHYKIRTRFSSHLQPATNISGKRKIKDVTSRCFWEEMSRHISWTSIWNVNLLSWAVNKWTVDVCDKLPDVALNLATPFLSQHLPRSTIAFCRAAMLQSPVTSTPFSVKDILKLEQQHALNPNGFMGNEQDTAPLQSLQLQCMQSTLSRSLDLLYSPEKQSAIAGEQVKCALSSDDFDMVRDSCSSPAEEEMDPSEDTSMWNIAFTIWTIYHH